MDDELVVGRVTLNLPEFSFKFIQLPNSSVRCQVAGKSANKGAGYGLEIPVKYIFYGHQKAIDWIEKVIERYADLKCLKQSNQGVIFSSLFAN